MRLAVCVVAQQHGKLLIVARKKRPTDWNLPGGKVEDEESLEEAAARELEEETGLKTPIGEMSFLRVFVDVIDDFVAVCYIAHSLEGQIVQHEGEGEVRWGSWDEILTERSCFHEYNQKLYNTLKEQGFVR